MYFYKLSNVLTSLIVKFEPIEIEDLYNYISINCVTIKHMFGLNNNNLKYTFTKSKAPFQSSILFTQARGLISY